MDETEEEQKRGVTIECTTKSFRTPNRVYSILDAPGHRDFVSNMISGAAQANCAILVVDCMSSQFERGWDGYSGTYKEHVSLAKGLGVNQLIVALNKLEKVNWEQERYEDITDKIWMLCKKLGYSKDNVFFIPISGL